LIEGRGIISEQQNPTEMTKNTGHGNKEPSNLQDRNLAQNCTENKISFFLN